MDTDLYSMTLATLTAGNERRTSDGPGPGGAYWGALDARHSQQTTAAYLFVPPPPPSHPKVDTSQTKKKNDTGR